MQSVHLLGHLFIPRTSNNQKAKLLHSSTLAILILVLLLFQITLHFLAKVPGAVLGYKAFISPETVIKLTNGKRQEAGLEALELDPDLTQAALAKGTDMINRDYWAHIAPDGTEPWKFFKDFGYQYRYAGENLARDFSDPASAVNAWMASSSHRENLLSPKYQEIGVAVIEGDLAGIDTTLVVQFFGSKLSIAPPAAAAAEPTQAVSKIAASTASSFKPSQSLVSPFSLTRSVSLSAIALLLGVLVIDAVVIARKKVFRLAGRTFAHFTYLVMVLLIVLIARAGRIL